MELETIIGDLKSYSELEPGTFSHADQLTAEQVQDPSLQGHAFYVGDGPIYSLEGDKKTPILSLTREPDNLVLRHLNDEVNSSFDQLVNTGNFRPNAEEARKAIEAKDTLQVDLTKLRLKGDDAQWRYLEISTTGYGSLNAEERKLAERFYGQGTKFTAAMSAFKEKKIGNIIVCVLNPNYVRKEAAAGPVARAAWRFSFNNVAVSNAVVNYIYDRSGLRGVRRKVAAGGGAAPTGSIVAPSFEQVLAYSNPFVARQRREQYKAGLRKLFKQ